MIHLFALNPESFPTVRALDRTLDRLKTVALPGGGTAPLIHLVAYPRDVFAAVRALPYTEGLRLYAIGDASLAFDCVNAAALLPAVELAIQPFAYTSRASQAERELVERLDILVRAPSRRLNLMRCGRMFASGVCRVGRDAFRAAQAAAIRETLSTSRAGRRVLPWAANLAGSVVSAFYREEGEAAYSLTTSAGALDGQFSALTIENVSGLSQSGEEHGGAFLRLTVRSKEKTGVPAPLEASRGICKKIIIRCKRLMYVSLDGECFGEKRLSIESVPGALNLITADGI